MTGAAARTPIASLCYKSAPFCRISTGLKTVVNAKLEAPSHPLAGTTLTGADIIVQVLADEGVEVVFGYSGGAILPTYDAVFRYNAEHREATGSDRMPLIVPANEQGAGFMAAG
ncbi:MAG: acetolactate synthase, partial [Nevskia sp.]|nr:acetolactate synthase [Nevskia sp.]